MGGGGEEEEDGESGQVAIESITSGVYPQFFVAWRDQEYLYSHFGGEEAPYSS